MVLIIVVMVVVVMLVLVMMVHGGVGDGSGWLLVCMSRKGWCRPQTQPVRLRRKQLCW